MFKNWKGLPRSTICVTPSLRGVVLTCQPAYVSGICSFHLSMVKLTARQQKLQPSEECLNSAGIQVHPSTADRSPADPNTQVLLVQDKDMSLAEAEHKKGQLSLEGVSGS